MRKVPKDAWRLLERMRYRRNEWGQADFATLFEGFKFKWREGGKHRLYYLEEYPDIKPVSIGRHNELAKGYATDAVRRIDELIARERLTEENTR
jgi:hypothetical protein